MKKSTLIYIILTVFAIFGGIIIYKKVKKVKISDAEILSEVLLTQSILHNDLRHIIADFKVIKKYIKLEKTGEKILLTREFEMDGEKMFLATNPTSLKTFLISESETAASENIENEFIKTKLYALLHKKTLIKNLGLNSGYFLTVDLCQKPIKKSNKFEDGLFQFLAKQSEIQQEAIPVGIAVSGVWIANERENFEKILSLKSANKIDVIWINHSFSHPVNKNKFLTADEVNFEFEVLNLEQKLLENGQVPSIFFRFPGLTYNADLLEKLSSFSLIAIDADAWIAKKQKIKDGSIILVHGNGNEHEGVVKLLNEFKHQKPHFISIYL